MNIKACDWKYGKKWVYSITYDEGLVDLKKFAIPIHEEFGVPGHVEVVAGQLGEIRNLGQSSYNGMRHMNGKELKELIDMGWGVGNHSWSHEIIDENMLDKELREARDVIEEAIDSKVHLYCAPGNNINMADHILDEARNLGYLGAMSLTDALNRPGEELFWINRTALHDQFYEPFFSEFDPFRNIAHAEKQNGWIIDYCHCPLEEPVHPNKDCSESQLRQRLQTVVELGGSEVWCAVPEEVIFYHLCRRHLKTEVVAENDEQQSYILGFQGLSNQVENRDLTFEIIVPTGWCRSPVYWVDDTPCLAEVVRPNTLRCTVTIEQDTKLRFGPGKNS